MLEADGRAPPAAAATIIGAPRRRGSIFSSRAPSGRERAPRAVAVAARVEAAMRTHPAAGAPGMRCCCYSPHSSRPACTASAGCWRTLLPYPCAPRAVSFSTHSACLASPQPRTPCRSRCAAAPCRSRTRGRARSPARTCMSGSRAAAVCACRCYLGRARRTCRKWCPPSSEDFAVLRRVTPTSSGRRLARASVRRRGEESCCESTRRRRGGCCASLGSTCTCSSSR